MLQSGCCYKLCFCLRGPSCPRFSLSFPLSLLFTTTFHPLLVLLADFRVFFFLVFLLFVFLLLGEMTTPACPLGRPFLRVRMHESTVDV